MSEWLDTKTKALLQNVPPDKLAPPDTAGFTLVLLSKPENPARLQYAAKGAGWLQVVMNAALSHRCPAALATGLTLDDAMLGQFELACCDSASVFIRDDVVTDNDRDYLFGLYKELLSSEEFQPVAIQVQCVPRNDQGGKYLQQFLGTDEESVKRIPIPLNLMVMKKKARIMHYWARKIGADVTIGKS